MSEADKTMRKYWLVAVMLLALCWGAEAERERTHTLDSLGRERDGLLVEVKTLQENTLRRVKGASPVLADRLVYEMHKGITACRYSLSKIATAIEEELYEGRQVSEEEHQLAQKRIPYADVGGGPECIAPENRGAEGEGAPPPPEDPHFIHSQPRSLRWRTLQAHQLKATQRQVT